KLQAKFGEKISNLPQAFQQLLEFGIFGVVRQKSGMERYQPQAETPREGSVGFEIAPIFFPGAIRNDAAGAANRFHAGVIFADGRDHARNKLDSVQGAKCPDVSPDIGIRADGIEGDLEAGDSDLLDPVDEL